MINLKQVLLKHQNLAKAGDQSSTGSNNNSLIDDLIKVSNKNNIFFWICVGMVLCVFIGMFIFIAINNADKKAIETIVTTSGISIAGLIFYMNKLWKEKVNSDMMLVLARNLGKKEVNTIVLTLLNKLNSKE